MGCAGAATGTAIEKSLAPWSSDQKLTRRLLAVVNASVLPFESGAM